MVTAQFTVSSRSSITPHNTSSSLIASTFSSLSPYPREDKTIECFQFFLRLCVCTQISASQTNNGVREKEGEHIQITRENNTEREREREE